MNLRLLAVGLLTSLLAPSCIDTRTQAEPPKNPVEAKPIEDLLGPGDVIEIKVFEDKEASGIFPISEQGKINFPMIGEVVAAQKGALTLQEEIRDRLDPDYVKNATVQVTVRERNSQRVHVLGHVTKAGTFAYREGMGIIEAITLASGFTKLAAKDRVIVTRMRAGKEERFEVRAGDIAEGKVADFPLEPGDRVFVPEAWF
jgi:polysaccharide export outer membrane protein